MTRRIGADLGKTYLFKLQSCRTQVLASSICSEWWGFGEFQGWNRLQLKHGGKYLDAEFCSTKIGLNPGSLNEGRACQLWRLVLAADG